MGVAFSFLSAICWAFSTTYARKAQNRAEIGRLAGLFVTLVVNNGINLLIFSASMLLGVSHSFPRDGMVPFVLGGVLNSLIGRGLFFVCIFYIGAARAGVVKAITPIFAILGGSLLLGERVTSLAAVSVAAVLSGVFLISVESAQRVGSAVPACGAAAEKRGGPGGVQKKGILIGSVASAFLALGNVFRKAGMNVVQDPILGVSVGSLSALLGCVIFLAATGRAREMAFSIRHPEPDYVVSGAATSGALYFLFLALNYIPISIANSLTSTEPLFTLAIGFLLLRQSEKLTWKTAAGAFTVVAGAAILVLM